MLGEGFFLCVAFGLARTLLRWGRRLRATRRPDHAIPLTAGPGSVASAIRGLPPVVTRSVDPLVMAVPLRSPDCRAVLGRICRSFNHVPVERASTVSKASRSRGARSVRGRGRLGARVRSPRRLAGRSGCAGGSSVISRALVLAFVTA